MNTTQLFATTFLCAVTALAAEVKPKQIGAYFDCHPDGVIVHPGESTIGFEELKQPTNTVTQVLDTLSANRTSQYVIVLVRPGAVKIYRQIRNMIGARPIDVVYEPVAANWVFQWGKGLNIPPVKLLPNPAPVVRHLGVPAVVRTTVISTVPAFFECRNNEIFFVDKATLDKQVEKVLPADRKSGNLKEFLKSISSHPITNEYYSAKPSYLQISMLALDPLPGIHGDTIAEITAGKGKFNSILTKLDPQKHYLSFMLRDDSFEAFRAARKTAHDAGFNTGWELLGKDEPMKFGSGLPAAVIE